MRPEWQLPGAVIGLVYALPKVDIPSLLPQVCAAASEVTMLTSSRHRR